jgi:hypothetical protein
MSGLLAALIAGENKRSPPILGFCWWPGLDRGSDLAVCSHLYQSYLYGASNSNDDYWR